MSRIFLVAVLLCGAARAGLGDGFGGGATGAAGLRPATLTYPRVSVQVGAAVSISPTVSGITPGTYSVVAGSLPDGLSLNSSTGAITGSVTTTAMLGGGTGTSTGRYNVTITAGDSASTKASVAIDVYAVDIPNPLNLLKMNAASVSGSNFIDAIDGTTWTKTVGTTDSDLTDANSPLGYSHTFNGSTYFTSGRSFTGHQNRFTIASFVRDHTVSGTFGKEQLIFDNGSGWYGVGAPRFTHNNPSFASIEGGSQTFKSYVQMNNGGAPVQMRGWYGGEAVETVYSRGSSTTTVNAPTRLIAGAGFSLVTSAYGYHGDMAESAYWQRTLIDVDVASMEYCWRRGVSLTSCNGTNAPSGNTVTIDLTEPSSDHPITYSGSYTLTGTATGNTAVTCSASPSTTETCTCTGTTSWSCTVSVTPTAANEGVETISIAATSSTGQAIARQDVGFKSSKMHAYDARSFDGNNNATIATGDLLSTWADLGTTPKNLTSSGGNRPTARLDRATSPFARFSGSNFMDAAASADWTFLHDGTDWTIEVTFAADSYASTQYLLNTNDAAAGACTTTGKGVCVGLQATTTAFCGIQSGAGQITSCGAMGAVLVAGRFHLLHLVHDDDGGAGNDLLAYSDNALRTSNARSGAFGVGGGSALRVGRSLGSTTNAFTGDIMAITIHNSASTSTQRAIDSAVESWAAGGNW